MRTLQPAPRVFVPGSYAGPLPRFDSGDAARWPRLLRQKKWIYVAITSEEVWLSLAVVRMGYAASAFAFAFDRRATRMLVDHAVVAKASSAAVTDEPFASGPLATFRSGRTSLAIDRRGETCSLTAQFPDLELDATFDLSAAPPAISAIVEPDATLRSATEKRVLAPVRGRVTLAGRTVSLDGALAGYDYTQGLMPRRTRWKWAFAMGHAKTGERVAFNVVEGFVGEAECAAFDAAGVYPLREPRISFASGHPDQPWHLTGEGMNLVFDVGAIHAQRTNLVVVRSRFLQPVGWFRGTIRVGDRDVELDGVPGVVEDQDVLW